MSFLSFGKKQEQVSLVVDVGNSTVTSSLVLFSGNDLPVFLYTVTDSLAVGDKADASRLLESFRTTLDIQLANLTKNGFTNKYWNDNEKVVRSAIVSFSSPWFMLKTKHLVITNEKDFVVTQAFIDDVMEKEESLFVSELFETTKSEFHIVEKNIIHTKINGYTLNSPIGKKTKNLDAYLCMSAMDHGIVDTTYNSVLRSLHIPKENIAIHTFPVVAFSVIRDLFNASGNFLIMDVTGDMSDITLVQDSVILQTVSMPSGRNFILRQISKTFGVSIEIAESMLHLYSTEKIDDVESQKIHDLMAQIESEWAIYFENSLLELSPTLNLPGNFYLMTQKDVSEIYESFLKVSKVDATVTFRKSLNIVKIDENSVKDFFKNESITQVDEFSVFVSLFFKKILNS